MTLLWIVFALSLLTIIAAGRKRPVPPPIVHLTININGETYDDYYYDNDAIDLDCGDYRREG
jgi:hypothetical protein